MEYRSCLIWWFELLIMFTTSFAIPFWNYCLVVYSSIWIHPKRAKIWWKRYDCSSQSYYHLNYFGDSALWHIFVGLSIDWSFFPLLYESWYFFPVFFFFLFFYFLADFGRGKGDKIANGGKSSATKDPHQFEHRVDQSWCLYTLSLVFFCYEFM